MKHITVLGAGMVGRAMALDLASSYTVTAVDVSEKNLEQLPSSIQKRKGDLNDAAFLRKAIDEADIVLGAVPGFMGFEVCRKVISCGKNLVDISFFPENAFELDQLAREKNCIAIVDCGVAPGMGNILLGYHAERMQVENFLCLVGGLPFTRKKPHQYKAPFSPVDVLEEYTRPARYVVNGKVVTMPALSEVEEIHFDEVGTLEAFNSDGLRSLLYTMKIPNMKEKTLRWPGHARLMEELRSMGFFSETEIQVNRHSIRPIDVTAALFFPEWKYAAGEKEFTIMRILIDGIENGQQVQYRYNLFDVYDDATKTSSMERTTGYTATAAVNMVLSGLYNRTGISPPEFIGKEEQAFQYILQYLNKRGVKYTKQKFD
jgi:saccharopine dehydrogenase-like NADP-dependent oxidoreductase